MTRNVHTTRLNNADLHYYIIKFDRCYQDVIGNKALGNLTIYVFRYVYVLSMYPVAAQPPNVINDCQSICQQNIQRSQVS